MPVQTPEHPLAFWSDNLCAPHPPEPPSARGAGPRPPSSRLLLLPPPPRSTSARTIAPFSSAFPRLRPVPSKHTGVVGKPSEMTNKYFNHCLKKIRFKIKTLYSYDFLPPYLHSFPNNRVEGPQGRGGGIRVDIRGTSLGEGAGWVLGQGRGSQAWSPQQHKHRYELRPPDPGPCGPRRLNRRPLPPPPHAPYSGAGASVYTSEGEAGLIGNL